MEAATATATTTADAKKTEAAAAAAAAPDDPVAVAPDDTVRITVFAVTYWRHKYLDGVAGLSFSG